MKSKKSLKIIIWVLIALTVVAFWLSLRDESLAVSAGLAALFFCAGAYFLDRYDRKRNEREQE